MKKTIITLIATAPLLIPSAVYAKQPVNTSIKQQTNDSVITAKVKTKLLLDKALKSVTIAVFTDRRIVMLKGVVNSDTQYKRAVEIAQSVDGVNDVDADKLSVKDSNTPLKDITITAKLNGKIIREKLFSDKNIQYTPISIETKNGVVYITGTVKSDRIVNNILKIVKNTKGVKGIMNLLKVSNH